MENTEKNNKLIAEFMGAIIRDKFGGEEVEVYDLIITNPVWDGDIKYNQSWDWLMPVVTKIATVCPEHLKDAMSERLNPFVYDIDSIYSGVVEFVKRYNNQH